MDLGGGHQRRISLGAPAVEDRRWHLVVFGGLYLVGAALLYAGLAGPSTPGSKAMAIIAVVVLIGTEIGRRAHNREIDPGYVTSDGEFLIINHPPLFKEPLRIPLSQIEVAATDHPERLSDQALAGGIDSPGFPVIGESWDENYSREQVGYLWQVGWPFPFRTLGRNARRPNFLILFNFPVQANAYRKTPLGPGKNEALAGIAGWTPDVVAAESAFSEWRLLGQIDEEDLEIVDAIHFGELTDPASTARPKIVEDHRRVLTTGWSIAALGIIVPFFSLLSAPFALSAWRLGDRVHAVGMVVLSVSLFAYAVHSAMHPDDTFVGIHLAKGAALTVAGLMLYAIGRIDPGSAETR